MGLKIICLLWDSGDCYAFFFSPVFFSPLSCWDDALKKLVVLGFFYFYVSLGIGNHEHSFFPFLLSLRKFKLTHIGFFVFEDIFILTQKP